MVEGGQENTSVQGQGSAQDQDLKAISEAPANYSNEAEQLNSQQSLKYEVLQVARQAAAATNPQTQAIVDDGENFIFEALSDVALSDIERRTALFDEIAKDFSCSLGKSESRRERSERGLQDINLTYGEIEFKSFFQVFKWIQKTYKDEDPDCWHNAFNKPGGKFIDLGHGTGKGVLAGAMMHQFERVSGIEILQSLQDISLDLKRVYEKYLAEVDPVGYETIFGWPVGGAPQLDFVLGDIMEENWDDADMIFCNSTCFTARMMETIYQKTLKCKKGTWFVTMSKRLPHAEKIDKTAGPSPGQHWEFILAIKLEMSWGKATVNVQRKITHPN